MIDRALQHGYKILEIDTVKTKDGKWVVCHDKNLSRLTGLDKQVTDLDYQEIPPFKEVIEFEYYDNKPFKNVEFPEKKMDFLEDLFAKVKDQPLFMSVEVRSKNDKDLDRDLEEAVEISKKYCLKERIVWGFTNKSVKSSYKKKEGLITYVSSGSVYLTIISFLFSNLDSYFALNLHTK